MKLKNKIFFDIDDTIIDTNDFVRKNIKELYNFDVLLDVPKTSNKCRSAIPGYSVDETTSIIEDLILEKHDEIKIYPKFNDIFNFLYKHINQPINLLSSRNTRLYDVTNDFFNKNFPNIEFDIICCNERENKKKYLEDARILVEDDPVNAMNLQDHVNLLLLMTRPTNIDFIIDTDKYKKIVRCESEFNLSAVIFYDVLLRKPVPSIEDELYIPEVANQ